MCTHTQSHVHTITYIDTHNGGKKINKSLDPKNPYSHI